jgi:toxin ParE1/3/4
MAEIRWSLTAERDLRKIEEFIAEESPLRALAFVDRLIQAAEALEFAPQLGRVVPELEQDDLRELIFRGYRIVYLRTDTESTILRVVHGARDLESLVRREPWDLR